MKTKIKLLTVLLVALGLAASIHAVNAQVPSFKVGGHKYNAVGSLGVPGVRISVSILDPQGNVVDTLIATTAADGSWFVTLPAGTQYTACEIIPETGISGAYWVQICSKIPAVTSNGTAHTTASGCWVGTVCTGDTLDVNFCDICVGPGGGRTIGFWGNKNGQALITDADLAILNQLNLYGSPVFGSAADVKTYLKNANAVDMRYMLSAQLIAMELNVLHSNVTGVQGTDLVYLVPFGLPGVYTDVTNLMYAANLNLGMTTTSRDYYERLKNALDAANNGLDYVAQTNCPVIYPPT